MRLGVNNRHLRLKDFMSTHYALHARGNTWACAERVWVFASIVASSEIVLCHGPSMYHSSVGRENSCIKRTTYVTLGTTLSITTSADSFTIVQYRSLADSKHH